MNGDIIKEKKKLYFLLMGLGVAFIVFLLTLIMVGKGERKEKIELPPDLKKGEETKEVKPVFSCGERIFYQGYEYKTVKIGEQCWLAENLRATQYRDGSPIANPINNIQWRDAKEGAYACYENLIENCQKFGMLYNWLVIENEKGICPQGWRVPSHQDWAKLEMTICQNLGYGNCDVPFGEAAPFGWRGRDEGKHLKSKTFRGLDSFGFNLLLGGFRSPDGSFSFQGEKGFFWTAGDFNQNFAYARMWDVEKDQIRRFSDNKKSGFSLRCLKE